MVPRPVEDILWTDESYRTVYQEAGLEAVQVIKPLAKGDEPYSWVSETRIAPWVIYVLQRAKESRFGSFGLASRLSDQHTLSPVLQGSLIWITEYDELIDGRGTRLSRFTPER